MNAVKSRAGMLQWPQIQSHVLFAVILFVGIPASFVLYVVVDKSVERVNQVQFDREANAAHGVLRIRLESYTSALYALRAQFVSEKAIDRRHFQSVVRAMEIGRRYPYLASINYAAHVPAHRKAAFETAVRADTSVDPAGYPSFAITPPGERPEYFVIVYLEPEQGYDFAFGLDIGANPRASDPERIARALRDGRDSGSITASAQPFRVNDGLRTDYLAVRLAVYKNGMPVETVDQRRQAYVGSVGAAFSIEKIIRQALAVNDLQHLRCRLFDLGVAGRKDGEGAGADRLLLFDTANPPGLASNAADAADPLTHFIYRVRIEIANRLWEFEYSAPRRMVMSGIDRALAPLALGGALLITLLIAGIVYSLASAHRRAVSIAETIAHDLRASETGLAEVQRTAHMGNWTLDPQTWTMNWSDEACRVFGLPAPAGSVPFSAFLARVPDDDRALVDHAIRSAVANHQDGDVEHRIMAEGGEVWWLRTMARPGMPNRDGLVTGLFMDITVRKQLAENLMSSREELQALYRELVDIQERERRRFSRELHDVIGQNLTALYINLDIIKSQLHGDSQAAVTARLVDASQLLHATTDAIQNVMAEMRPPMLDDYGLLAALQWYASQFTGRTGIQVTVTGDDKMQRLPAAAEIALFRVAQEALNNVLKHARACHVAVSVQRGPAQCMMSIVDDGTGLRAGDATAGRRPGLGMVTMRERMQAIGGTISVNNAAGHGTQVELRVPC